MSEGEDSPHVYHRTHGADAHMLRLCTTLLIIHLAACFRAEEIMAPILMFKVAGHEVTVLSVAGGKIPLDEASMNAPFRTEEVDKFLADGVT